MKLIGILRLATLVLFIFSSVAVFSQKKEKEKSVKTSTKKSIKKEKEEPIVSKPDYKNAFGIRAGNTSGLTFKHFFTTRSAFEGILGVWQNAFGITGLYEKHAPTGLAGLKFYYGAGLHVTKETGSNIYKRYDNNGEYSYRYGRDGLAVGIDGVVGIDWKITVIPLAISLDLKPMIELSNHGTIYTAIDPSLGIKIAF